MLFTGADLYTSGEQELWHSCWASNQLLITSLRADANEDSLHELALDDWKKSRLSESLSAPARDLGHVRCVPRFGVEQGVKADGPMKLRAVDHFLWSHRADVGNHGCKRKRTKKAGKASSMNGHYDMSCIVAHDHLDAILASLRRHQELIGEVHGLWYSDIYSAGRRVPVKREHSSATGIAYLHRGVTLIAQHCGMPPMAPPPELWHGIALSHCWPSWLESGCTCLYTAMSIIILHAKGCRILIWGLLPNFWFFIVVRLEAMEHSMQLLARLVRFLRGDSAIADKARMRS